MSAYTLLCGDALRLLGTLPEASAQCVITSPPYFGLRDYQTSHWEGGAGDCDHMQERGPCPDPRRGSKFPPDLQIQQFPNREAQHA